MTKDPHYLYINQTCILSDPMCLRFNQASNVSAVARSISIFHVDQCVVIMGCAAYEIFVDDVASRIYNADINILIQQSCPRCS